MKSSRLTFETLGAVAAFAGTILAPQLAHAQQGPPPGPKPSERGNPISRLMSFDKNGDGKLTADELTDERLQPLFDRADSDKDGAVTREELEKAIALGRDEHRGGPGGRGPGRDGFGGPPPGSGRGSFDGGPRGFRPDGPGGREEFRPRPDFRGGPQGFDEGPQGSPPGFRGGPRGPLGFRGGPQGPQGFDGGPQGPPMGMGMHGGPAMRPKPGQVLPPFMAEHLNLTEKQQRALDDLQKDTEKKLDKIMTPEQREQLKAMREQGPLGFGPGGPQGPRGFGQGGPQGPRGFGPSGPQGPGAFDRGGPQGYGGFGPRSDRR